MRKVGVVIDAIGLLWGRYEEGVVIAALGLLCSVIYDLKLAFIFFLLFLVILVIQIVIIIMKIIIRLICVNSGYVTYNEILMFRFKKNKRAF